MAPWSDEAKAGESGLADKYQFTIRTAHYGLPFTEEDGTTPTQVCALILEGERRLPNGDTEDAHIWLTCGSFEPGDKEGTFAIHDTQEEGRHFARNSKMGKWLKSALEQGIPLEERQAPDRSQYEEKDATIWPGLIVDVHEVEEEFKLRQGPDKGKVVTSRSPKITAFVGTVEGGAAPAAAAEPTSNGTNQEKATLIRDASPNYMKYLETVTGELGLDPSDPLASEEFFKAKA